MKELREQILELVCELVRIRSTEDRLDELQKVVDFVEERLKHPNLLIHRYEHNGKPSLVATFHETKWPKVMFVGHLDVVEGEDEQFEPRIEGDRIYGRGVIDMKGPDAVMIQLFFDLAKEGIKPDIGLMLTTDEEVGSKDGVEYLLKHEGWGADFAIIPDSGGTFEIVYKGKGVLHLKAIAKGKASHGSRPWLGHNAIDSLIDFYTELKNMFPKEPCGIPDHWHHTLNLGKINGGKVVNQVPDYAEMHLDIRFIEPWTSESMFNHIKKIADRHSVGLEVVSRGELVATDPNHPYVQAFKKAAEHVLGRQLKLVVEHGATDGRFFAEKKIQNIVTCSEGGGAHSPNEWASISSYLKLYQAFRIFLKEL